MDDTLVVLLTRGPEGSDACGSRDPVAHPEETSKAQRTAPVLVLWSDEPGGSLEPAQEEKKSQETVPMSPYPAEKATHEITHTSFRTGSAVTCELELRTIQITENHTKSQSSRSS